MQSGDVVLLFNLKHHAYVSCKGSFACDEPPLNSTLASNGNDSSCFSYFTCLFSDLRIRCKSQVVEESI